MGILRIGFIAPATVPILPSLVQTYVGRYPDVELKLHHMNPDDQLAAFDEGLLDLGLSRPLPPECRRYFEEEVVYIDHLGSGEPTPRRRSAIIFRFCERTIKEKTRTPEKVRLQTAFPRG